MVALLPILLALLVLGSPAPAAAFPANQPFASYWFPNELLTWSPGSDPDAEYNRCGVPLAARFTNPATQANAHARDGEAGVTGIAIMFPTTSNDPSQGSSAFAVNAFHSWEYMDMLVFWGGSAGEGLILAPSPDVIAAAHRNGVPVLGTIFFPPNVFGGQIQWVWDLLQKTDSTYVVADKLIEVADTYGFDGWFLNQETSGGDTTLADEMKAFLRYFEAHKSPGMRMMWYDSMIRTGAISWQNELNNANRLFFESNGVVSDAFFVNFGWGNSGRLQASRAKAIQLLRDPYEVFAGIDVQANGYNTNADWDTLFTEGQAHTVSVGFYGTEWPYSSSTSHADYYARESRFWVGANGDPSNTATASAWKGLAHYIPERSPAMSLPFVTSFNTGQGHLFAVNGEVLRAGDWNHRGLQDVLPTYRWIVDSPAAALVPALDWSDAYQGGSCLRVSGDLGPANTTDVTLYKAKLPVAAGTNLALATKRGAAGAPSGMSVGLAFEDSPAAFHYLAVDSAATAGWNTQTWSLAPFAGRTIALVSLRFESGDAIPGYAMKIGRIAVIDGATDLPAAPSAPVVDSFVESDWQTGSIRLRWSPSPDPVAYYQVFRRNPGGSRTWLGASPSTAAFLWEIKRAGAETTAVLEIQAVGAEFGFSAPETTSVTWTMPALTGVDDGTDGGRDGQAQGAGPDLEQSAPNPFLPPSRIRYGIPADGAASLAIYDAAGRRIVSLLDGPVSRGRHEVGWDGRDGAGRDVAPGIYFSRLESGGRSSVRKLFLIRP